MAGRGPKMWVSGDLNGFFGLFTNSLTNVLATVFLLTVPLGFPPALVFGRIVPGLVLSIAVGNIYYAWMAWRLGKKEGRDNVTAVPYGVSVPHYFIVIFAIMLPLFLAQKESLGVDAAANLALSVGVAWCFVHAIVAYFGAFIGPTLRKVTPRAAMLGTLAGVAITFIAMAPAFQVWQLGWIGMISLGIISIGWLANVEFPFKIPAGLLAVIVGTILGWASGYMKFDAVSAALSTVQVAIPLPQVQLLIQGLPRVMPYLVTAIPLAFYLFLESLNNIESASAGGDHYSTREAMLVAATGTLVGSLFGSPFPTLIYIGHPGWKSVGARVGYSWATGLGILLLGMTGIFGVVLSIIPIVAILPILIYIGLLITSQAFNASPARHAPAVAIALIPWIASFVQGQIDNSLNAAGTNAVALTVAKLGGAGVIYDGMKHLGAGAILVGMVLAAILAYIIDRKWWWAAGWAVFGASMSFFGFMHASELGLNRAPGMELGYLGIAVTCALMYYYAKGKSGLEPIMDDTARDAEPAPGPTEPAEPAEPVRDGS
jgi:AGZA family xanthine/uracil permease-like MFS transporter